MRKAIFKPFKPTSPIYFAAIDSLSDFATPLNSKPNATFRITDAQGNNAKSWNTKALSGPGSFTIFPLTITSHL